jgi:hypothetical protein
LETLTGLSFSLKPPSSGKYVYTTIEAVNATGKLVAIKDAPNHVSVFPIGYPIDTSVMRGWVNSGPGAQTTFIH